MLSVRFRTLGCYPLSAAIPSVTSTLDALIVELRHSKYSERLGRLIDGERGASMEAKKNRGLLLMTALRRAADRVVSAEKSSGRVLLRFLTCGSVHDGKSTLIGRLLVDAGLVPEDQYAAAKRASGGALDYAFLLDGLEAEREQGITIDAAYRYFSTKQRSFIAADCPGHEQFTRNVAVARRFPDTLPSCWSTRARACYCKRGVTRRSRP